MLQPIRPDCAAQAGKLHIIVWAPPWLTYAAQAGHAPHRAQKVLGLVCMALLDRTSMADTFAAQAGTRRTAARSLLELVCVAALLGRGAASAAALPAMGIPPGTGAWLGVSMDFSLYPRCSPPTGTAGLGCCLLQSQPALHLYVICGSSSIAPLVPTNGHPAPEQC